MAAFFFPFRFTSQSFSSHLLLFTLVLSLARPNLAAYVQRQDCLPLLAASGQQLSSQPQLAPDSLSAFLENDDQGTSLEIQITGHYPDLTSCDQILRQNVSTGVTLAQLGGSHRYPGAIANTSCYPSPWAQNGSKQLVNRLKILFRVDRPHLLAAFTLNVDVRGADDLPTACLNSFLTPSIGSTAYGVCLWGPSAILLLVVLAAGWREISIPGQPTDEEENVSGSPGSSRVYLTRIADCLSYIQFVFFSGALSLRYPGFLQPVVSPSSWSTLMLPRGLVIRDSVYYGVNDGIYEVNGTFGGTPGLELMTQVIGAPVTMATWANIISLAFVLLIFLFGVIQLGLSLRWTRDWFREASFWTLDKSATDRYKATAWVALRVFLSYFLMPIVAWTTYQLDRASFLPKYYTVLTCLVITLVLVACWWGMSQRSPQNMGYLIIDNFEDHATGSARNQDVFTLATFLLLIARGTAIGGLQAVATPQLILLIGCEVAQLGLIVWAWSVSGLLSRGSMVPCARLTVLLACIGMIPGISSYEASSAIGYSVLMFHALVLVVLFLVPSLYEIAELAMAKFQSQSAIRPFQDEERPQVFGLRQLRRRPDTRNNLSIQGMHSFDRDSSASSNTPSSLSARGSSSESGPSDPELLRTYFRSPRPETTTARLMERSHRDKASEGFSLDESQSSNQSEAAPVPAELPIPSPANPTVDYAFREADLYYGRPRRVSFHQNGPSASVSTTFMQTLKSWARWR
ncbi:hypothetical protein AK830_g11924 [Neonectria ditissima]|uniref:TRP C-terminal domain-containing protein n=1 Tax=Neonectria ditissima TaxID=78410 RepID=A0A0P7B055_9HYPO|nr:hypothetical protein AK830_g11924 [Neonectria ditissima]